MAYPSVDRILINDLCSLDTLFIIDLVLREAVKLFRFFLLTDQMDYHVVSSISHGHYIPTNFIKEHLPGFLLHQDLGIHQALIAKDYRVLFMEASNRNEALLKILLELHQEVFVDQDLIWFLRD